MIPEGLCQHSDTFVRLKSCFSVKVPLGSGQWNGLPAGEVQLPPLAENFWVLKVESLLPLVLSFAAIWVLCSGFEDGVPLMYCCYYCCCCHLSCGWFSAEFGAVSSCRVSRPNGSGVARLTRGRNKARRTLMQETWH